MGRNLGEALPCFQWKVRILYTVIVTKCTRRISYSLFIFLNDQTRALGSEHQKVKNVNGDDVKLNGVKQLDMKVLFVLA